MAGDKDARTSALVGRTLKGKWRLESQIGTGGMASVWAARHRNGKRVAIKLLHAELSRDDHIKGRFLREGYVANKVQHPSVVTILDDEDEGDLVFLVMELLEGETLSDRWKRNDKRLPLRDVLEIADAVLDGLAAAHDKQIVHRDIKPANIFLTTAGDVKILDFGIARLHEGKGGTGLTTRLGTSLGSPAFMSPEQARARWEFVDARTDIWAMGAVMFAALAGRYVHGQKTSAELIIATATTPAPSLRDAWPEAPDVVTAIVDRALAFERADRWQDARAMQAAVRRALAIDFDKPREPVASLPDVSMVDAAAVARQVQALGPLSSGSIAIIGLPTAAAEEPAKADAAPISAAPPEAPRADPDPAEAHEAAAPAPRTHVTELLPTLQKAQAAAPGESTTSAAVAAPSDAGQASSPVPRHRSVVSMAVLGAFIALGLIGGGVAIGLLSRRPAAIAAPSPPPATAAASPPTAPAPTAAPTPPEPPPSASEAVPPPAAEPTASATATAAASAAPPPATKAPRRSTPRAPRPKGRTKYDPTSL
jgi:serine/threonine-protein kinase